LDKHKNSFHRISALPGQASIAGKWSTKPKLDLASDIGFVPAPEILQTLEILDSAAYPKQRPPGSNRNASRRVGMWLAVTSATKAAH
jgi:hypothetical protein